MRNIRVASAQYPLNAFSSFEDWRANAANWVREAAANRAQLLVFPEYGSLDLLSLFDRKIQRDLQGQIRALAEFKTSFLETYSKLAREYGVYILAPSFPTIEPSHTLPINRVTFFSPNGKTTFQDKLYMTRFEDERWGIESGKPVLKVIKTPIGNIGIQICFDGEFSLPTQALSNQGIEILLHPSCTESMKGLNRVHIGARARALENQIYVVVSQTVGTAPWCLAADKNTGRASFYSTPDDGFTEDGVVVEGKTNEPGWVYADLNLDALSKVRESGHVFNFKHTQNLTRSIENIPYQVEIIDWMI